MRSTTSGKVDHRSRSDIWDKDSFLLHDVETAFAAVAVVGVRESSAEVASVAFAVLADVGNTSVVVVAAVVADVIATW